MDYKIPPWSHQLEAIEKAKDLPYFALFFEMGAGKSSAAINILRHKFNTQRRFLRTLVLCPPIVVPNWREEWLRHSQIPPDRVVLLRGSGRQRAKLFESTAWHEADRRGMVFITNYESLLMPELYEAFRRWEPEALILDESHKCKDRKTKRSKLAEGLANPMDARGRTPLPAPVKLILTGSPVLNSPMDLFMQYLILDGGATFGRNFFVFQGKYFRDKNAGMPRDRHFPDWVPRPGAIEEISQKISLTGMRVEKKDCMDLPPLVRTKLRVPMDPEQSVKYAEMKRDFITYVESKAVTATLTMTKALRLMQIASGFVRTVEGEEIPFQETPKMAALRDLLTELTPNHKVLIWAVWKNNYAQIRAVCEKLNIDYVEVHGEISDGQKHKNVERFKTEPKCRVFIGHPGSGGIGINLVTASYSIFYSRTFSLEHSLQAEARNHRGGSEIHEKITRIDLTCEGTIDELVCEKLVNKQEISDRLLKDLATELKAL